MGRRACGPARPPRSAEGARRKCRASCRPWSRRRTRGPPGTRRRSSPRTGSRGAPSHGARGGGDATRRRATRRRSLSLLRRRHREKKKRRAMKTRRKPLTRFAPRRFRRATARISSPRSGRTARCGCGCSKGSTRQTRARLRACRARTSGDARRCSRRTRLTEAPTRVLIGSPRRAIRRTSPPPGRPDERDEETSPRIVRHTFPNHTVTFSNPAATLLRSAWCSRRLMPARS